MLTILSALGGLASSLLPDVIHGWLRCRQDAADRAQELAILRLQVERERAAGQRDAAAAAARLEEIGALADGTGSAALQQPVPATGVAWVDALNGSVRPVLTYCFFALFALHLLAQLAAAAGRIGDVALAQAVAQAWSDEVQALFAGVLGFWFGNRSMQHARRR